VLFGGQGQIEHQQVRIYGATVEHEQPRKGYRHHKHIDGQQVQGEQPAGPTDVRLVDVFHRQDLKLPWQEQERHQQLRGLLNERGHGVGSALKAGENPEDPEWNKSIFELIDAIDNYIPEPERETEKPFLMPVEDVFSITGRGTVGTGRVERGKVKVGDKIERIGIRETIETTVTGVEMFRKILDDAQAGDNIGLLLRGVDKKDLERGMVLAAPGSVTPHTKFEGEVYILTKEEGGRHTPFFNGYRPQFYFRTTDVTGTAELPEGTEMVMPGDNVEMVVTLITPIAMDKELRFAIREGGRTVGAGVVADIIE